MVNVALLTEGTRITPFATRSPPTDLQRTSDDPDTEWSTSNVLPRSCGEGAGRAGVEVFKLMGRKRANRRMRRPDKEQEFGKSVAWCSADRKKVLGICCSELQANG